jgi:protein-S-isoprenylcysteine O-methyltransferase Ste14
VPTDLDNSQAPTEDGAGDASSSPVSSGDPRDPSYWALLAAFSLVVAAPSLEAWFFLAAATGVQQVTGWCLVIAGAALTLWARVVIGRFYSPTATSRDPSLVLVRSGPYAWLNHPMYLGNLVSVVGLLLVLGARLAWLALVPFVAAQVWRVVLEQRFLSETFGRDWSIHGAGAPPDDEPAP